MIFSSHIPDIPSDNPFVNDLLDREQYADVLTSLIDTSKKGFTMSINATWGYGKTTFIRMWEAKLRAQGYSTVYVNAWEKDYIDNPFAAVMATIWSQTMKDSEHIKTPSKVIQTLGDIASKIIAHHYIGEPARKAIIKGLCNKVQNPYAIESYIEQIKYIEKFREQLSVYVNELQSQSENAKNKLIIFVDELDRCKPTYAVEMLERIKHLFSIDNVVFVLAVDQTVLQESIKGFYGSSNISAENYLRRFIDIEYCLPDPSIDNFIEFQVKYHELDQYISNHTPNPFLTHDKTNYSVLFKDIVDIFFNAISCSLRDIEKYFNRLECVIRTLKVDRGAFFVSVFLTYTYMFKKDIYHNITEFKYADAELLHTIEDLLIIGKIPLNTDNGQLAIGIMMELVLIYRTALELQHIEDDNRITELSLFESNHLINLNSVNVFGNDYKPRVQLNQYINKIELTEAIQ